MSVITASPQASFARIGSMFIKIAKHESYAIGFAVFASLVVLAGAFVVSSVFIPMGIVVASLIVIVYLRVQWYTREVMNSMETIGTANNIPQLVKFSRFLFNSIAAGFVGFIWAILCIIVMAIPYTASTSIPNYANTASASDASLAGEITLALVSVVMGFAYIPHAYKSWKFIDDYFILLHDPWPRDVGLAGVKKILDSYKIALVATFFTIPALGGYIPAAVMLSSFLIIQALIASGKYITGLNQVGDAFVRVQTMSLYATSPAQAVYRPPSGSQGYAPQNTPPPIMRYQPSQAIYAGGTTAQRRAAATPSIVDNAVSRDLLERSNAFIQIVNQDPSAPGRQRVPTHVSSTGIVPIAPVSPSTVEEPSNPAAKPAARGTRCKYCLAELPARMPVKCPVCGGILLDIPTNQ